MSIVEAFATLDAPKTMAERTQAGVAARALVAFADLAQLPAQSRDAVAMIAATEAHLLPDLLAARHQRMLKNPAAFFRGTAELMAQDLRHSIHTNINVLSVGDAHLQNFGFYASPERQLLFDLNDFDEAAPAPFEFDLKRLVTSVYLLGAGHHFDEDQMDELARHCAKRYRKTLKAACAQSALQRFYASSAVATVFGEQADLKPLIERAKTKDAASVVKKYTHQTASGLRFNDNPPKSVHVAGDTEIGLRQGLRAYRETTRADVNWLLRQYHLVDVIRHSVGIGSFGTHCYLALLSGPGGGPLVLQIKEALPHRQNLAQATTLAQEVAAGSRIRQAQEILQKASDPFLGWFNLGKRSFYVRQFRDMKESINTDDLNWPQYCAYAKTCAQMLALAHAQSPQAAVAVGYLQKPFDEAIQQWCKGYLPQVLDDFAAFLAVHPQK